MTHTRRLSHALVRGLVALAALVSLAGCSRRDDSSPEERSVEISATRRSAEASPERLGAGDIRIVTVDGGIDLALIGDTVSTGLSPQALAKVRTETDTANVEGSGFAASLEKVVKRTVAGSIGTRVGFPVSSVKDVRYEGGALKFDWAGKPPKVFVSTRINGRSVMESFAPADAEAFVAAVRARKRATRGPT